MPDQIPQAFRSSILVCEDEPVTLSDVAEVLRMNGHTVTEAMTVTDAAAYLDIIPVDILIADVSLPDMSGIELAQIARRINPRIGVIFATAHVTVPGISEIDSAVMLSKPYGEQGLLRAVAKLETGCE
ncbi:response regulator [Phyllobacterium sp. K27]